MQTIGLIGGMSWHSTASYYRIINEVVAERLGGHASAPITMQSLDFAAVRQCQVAGDWAARGTCSDGRPRRCVAGGADVVAICTNLMHKVAPRSRPPSTSRSSTSPTPSPGWPAAGWDPLASSAPAG